MTITPMPIIIPVSSSSSSGQKFRRNSDGVTVNVAVDITDTEERERFLQNLASRMDWEMIEDEESGPVPILFVPVLLALLLAILVIATLFVVMLIDAFVYRFYNVHAIVGFVTASGFWLWVAGTVVCVVMRILGRRHL